MGCIAVNIKRVGVLHQPFSVFGGAERDRTVDLMTASHALSQLSYSPEYFILITRVRNLVKVFSAAVSSGALPASSPGRCRGRSTRGGTAKPAGIPNALSAPAQISLTGRAIVPYNRSRAGVVKLVDAGDSKSPDPRVVSVRFRPPAPKMIISPGGLIDA